MTNVKSPVTVGNPESIAAFFAASFTAVFQAQLLGVAGAKLGW